MYSGGPEFDFCMEAAVLIDKDYFLLECCTLWHSRILKTFQRCLQSPSLGRLVHITFIKVAVITSEMSVKFYQTTGHKIPEESNLHLYRR
jgi:hypothetical protein